MSIEIDWEGLTTGSEGRALAVTIKDFIHDKFQQVQLPRFIRSVSVHSFDFGKECPIVVLKDICDPLPEFYENQDGGDIEDESFGNHVDGRSGETNTSLKYQEEVRLKTSEATSQESNFYDPSRPNPINTRPLIHRPGPSYGDTITSPFLSRSNTPGIPGGTSNLSYFHLPLSAGISGAQTPLAAVAGRNAFAATSSERHLPPAVRSSHLQTSPTGSSHHHQYVDPSSRPSTSDSYAKSPLLDHPTLPDYGLDGESSSINNGLDPDPSDLQIVLHISYTGSVSLSITAEILLDYPMPSFVGIPLKLNITGLSFDGVAVLAYLRSRAHFSFLGPEDARTLVGDESRGNGEDGSGSSGVKEGIGGLLREIQVESEIGRKEGGKQVLKNVGKVEKFVLEQVRRIFEDEFVWPSFWTFLV
ncbi:MAG: hypothetical protein Q9190_007272 [Brigantiaea leucoxantha]